MKGRGSIAVKCGGEYCFTRRFAEIDEALVRLGIFQRVVLDADVDLLAPAHRLQLVALGVHPYPGVMEDVPASRDYTGGFAVELMNKDLGLALESAAQAKVPVPMGQTAYVLYKTYGTSGGKGLDFSSIIRFLNPSVPQSGIKPINQ